jgi:hypothetical protein
VCAFIDFWINLVRLQRPEHDIQGKTTDAIRTKTIENPWTRDSQVRSRATGEIVYPCNTSKTITTPNVPPNNSALFGTPASIGMMVR